jgi:hypothetical protein
MQSGLGMDSANTRLIFLAIGKSRKHASWVNDFMKNRAFTTLCALCLGAVAASGQIFSTPIQGDWYPFGTENYNGQSQSQTYGQSFTVPATGNILDSWTFDLKNGGASPVNFEFFLMAWNGSMATGSVLFQSSEMAVPTSDTSYAAFTVDPDVALTKGSQYVMFINESGLNLTSVGFVSLGGSGPFFSGGSGASPLGGSFYFLDNGNTFSDVTSDAWLNFGWQEGSSDWGFTAYTAVFSNPATTGVPDAGSSMFLMSLGLGGIAALRRGFIKV